MKEVQRRSVEGLTDEQLDEFIDYWRERTEGYRLQREAVTRDHPDAYRLGYSGWWCSKYWSMGAAERERRRTEREKGQQQ